MSDFLHVQHFEFVNFKGLRSANYSPNGAHAYVIARNEQGKTSLLDFIFMMLSKRLKQNLTTPVPTEIINYDADRMEGLIELGRNGVTTHTVKVSMTRKTGKLDIKVTDASTGFVLTPSRAVLDELVGVVDFDITSFLRLAPKEKVKIMKEWTGIDFSDLETDILDFTNKAKTAKQQIESLEKELAPLLPFDKNQLEPKKLEDINAKRDQVLADQKRYDDYSEKVKTFEDKVAYGRDQALEIETTIGLLEKQIQQLQQDRDIYMRDSDELEIRVQGGKEWLNKTKRPDLSEIDTEYSELVSYNAQVERNKRAMVLHDQISGKMEWHKKYQTKQQELEQALKAEIANAKLPVPGLTFDENGLYLNKLPFESSQINTAELVIAAIQLQLPLMKKVGIARFDASVLDKFNRERVEKWANAHDIQLFEEVVDRESDEKGIQFVLKEREVV